MTHATALLLAAITSAASTVPRFDAPNLKREREMFRQFRERTNPAPMVRPPEMEREVAPDAYVETHAIKNGETLWSLSRLLYGDGNYWPRVWSQNSAIVNPHLIRPGHQVQILVGSEDDAPAFRITETGEDGAQLAALKRSGGGSGIEIPAPEIAPRPVLKVPASFPEWQTVYRRRERAVLDDRALMKKRDTIADRMYLRAWVEEHDLDPVGFFMENDTESGLPVVNQYVFVKLKKGTGQVGQKFLIANSAGEIRKVQAEFENKVPAFLIQAAGELRLTEQMGPEHLTERDRETFDCYRALITKTTGLSEHGNALIPGELPQINASAVGPAGSIESEIVGSEREVSSMLFGQGDIIFLNRGSRSGVVAGQIFEIFADRRSRYVDTPVRYSPAPSGRLKVVRTSDFLSTALVLSAHDSIMQGDSVRRPSDRPEEVEKAARPQLAPINGGVIANDPPGSGGLF